MKIHHIKPMTSTDSCDLLNCSVAAWRPPQPLRVLARFDVGSPEQTKTVWGELTDRIVHGKKFDQQRAGLDIACRCPLLWLDAWNPSARLQENQSKALI